MESFFEMQKVPNKVGFLSLAAAAPQNFPGSHASRVTSPLLVSLSAVCFSASGFKGKMLVPPFATTASSGQDNLHSHTLVMSFLRPHSLVIPAPKGASFQPSLKDQSLMLKDPKILSNVLNALFLLNSWASEGLS